MIFDYRLAGTGAGGEPGATLPGLQRSRHAAILQAGCLRSQKRQRLFYRSNGYTPVSVTGTALLSCFSSLEGVVDLPAPVVAGATSGDADVAVAGQSVAGVIDHPPVSFSDRVPFQRGLSFVRSKTV
jgi:hypothetical protein